MASLSGRTALITGAAGGIGRHISVALAREGARLVLTDVREDALATAAAELGATDMKPPTLVADITTATGIESLAVAARAEGVDILVNNAGIATPAAYHHFSPNEINAHVSINLLAPMQLTRAVLPLFLERRSGHIVHLASLAGHFGTPYAAPYGVTKAGLIAFSRALRQELRGTGVRCSAVSPGFVDTGLTDTITGAGVKVPRTLGLLKPQQVAGAVVRAIVRDQPEIVLSAGPVRPVLLLSAVSGRWHERLMRLAGLAKLFEETARRHHPS
jgi:short-subunit dehydrogenase